MKFDYSGENPLFQQVATELENAIFANIYQAGQQIPSTTEIANSYQINPATILKGINLLVNDNIVEKDEALVFLSPNQRMTQLNTSVNTTSRTRKCHNLSQPQSH